MINSETVKYKTHLESITTRELLKLADQAGIALPPDLDRIFIIRELLDNALDEESLSQPFFENDAASTDQYGSISTAHSSSHSTKTAFLPQQYQPLRCQ